MGPEAARIGARWREIMISLDADATAAEAELGRLLAAYAGPGRHYHDIGHIDALLELSRRYSAVLRNHRAVDLAIVYHDVVYDPVRADNEAASAALARAALPILGLDRACADKVAAYIEATAHMTAPATATAADLDLDHLLDFDLSILAAEPAAYDAYAAAIRREYALYPDAAYAKGRARVLQTLLAMPVLYRVPALAAEWEPRARANLTRELGNLAQ